MNPLGQVSLRAQKLRASLNSAESAWSDGSEGDLFHLFETVTADVNHLRKALLLPGLPEAFGSARFDDDLDERVRHTRNLWEHWEEPGPSMTWFEERYPGRTPWIVESVADGDLSVGGVFLVSEIRRALKNVKQAFIVYAQGD